MGWLVRALLGPVIWSAMFTAVYALHGLGCALGWPGRSMPLTGDLQRFALLALWIAGIVVHLVQIRLTTAPAGVTGGIVRAGGWIGLVSTLFTLMPIVVTSTCRLVP